MLFVFIGLALMAFTVWDWQREETDASIFSHWLSWLHISREDSPQLYGLALVLQLLLGLACIVIGVRS
ncbi:hypothetical protein CCO03_16690 [Comamonas serinivorans]|uniref:Uncharacterized protein n=1 Tax=Comamonas serinivorans TaxID=1082851 RepID=A0A1Y0ER86_9BURK|nr:hypothetical protein [Comamonas serinivorans]ARU06086.1 hypothetical protein CCO03_16690 [Comamonas serinivorans]